MLFTVLVSIFMKTIIVSECHPSAINTFHWYIYILSSLLPLLAHVHCKRYIPRTNEHAYTSSTMSRHYVLAQSAETKYIKLKM